jgi:hypothetical protein
MNASRGTLKLSRNKTRATVGLAATALAVVAAATPAGAASPPSTSPTVSHTYYSSSSSIPACSSGYACTIVAYGSGYYVFNFYNYGTYSLSNWIGHGGLTNAQTGGAAVRTYNSSGNQISCYPAAHITAEVDWTPAWSIKLTSSGC